MDEIIEGHEGSIIIKMKIIHLHFPILSNYKDHWNIYVFQIKS